MKKTNVKNSRVTSVRAPVATGKKIRFTEPKFLPAKPGCLRIEKWEYLEDISGSTSEFAVAKTLDMNPGMTSSFPWLSGMARLFESYRFEKLDYDLEPMAPTSATGTIALVPDYNSSDSAPISKVEALEFESAVRTAPWASCTMVSSKSNLQKRLSYFCRSSDVPSTSTVDLFDTGRLFVCVGDQGGTSKISELWVHYIVEFSTPQFDLSLAGLSGFISASSGLGNGNLFGSSATITGSIDMTASTLTLTFNQPFKGLVIGKITGTVITDFQPSGGTATTVETVNSISVGALVAVSNNIVTASKGQTVIFTNACTTCDTSVFRLASYDANLGLARRYIGQDETAQFLLNRLNDLLSVKPTLTIGPSDHSLVREASRGEDSQALDQRNKKALLETLLLSIDRQRS